MDLLGYDEDTFKEYDKLFNFSWEDYKIEIKADDDEGIEEEEKDGIIPEIRLVIKVGVEDYARIKKKVDILGEKDFIKKLVII